MSRVIVMKIGQFGELWKVFDRASPHSIAVDSQGAGDAPKETHHLPLEDSTELFLHKSSSSLRPKGATNTSSRLLQQLLDSDESSERVHKGAKIGNALKNKILSSSVGEDVLSSTSTSKEKNDSSSPSTSVSTTQKTSHDDNHNNNTDTITSSSEDQESIYLLNIIKDEATPSYDDNEILYSLSNGSTMTLLQNNEMEIADSYEGGGNSPTTSVKDSDLTSFPLSSSSTQIATSNAVSSSSISPDSPNHLCSSTSGANLFSREHIKEEEEGQRRMCLVCGDVASGFHYGVSSCEACKAFFKRTIQGNIEYTCPACNECEINKRRRKACQACRFQKCLKMGMLKEGVRLDRVRGGRQKYRRLIESSPYVTPHGPPQPPKKTLEDNKLLQVLRHCEPEAFLVNVDLAQPNYKNRTIAAFSDFYYRGLIGTIEWAKQIPGFSNLTINDQMKSLQSNWSEILVFSIIYGSQHSADGKLSLTNNFSLDESQAQLCGLTEFFLQCKRVLERIELLELRNEEFILLKAIIIANCDIQLENYSTVTRLRNNLLSALHDTTSVLRSGNPGINVQNVLLLLPGIRQADILIHHFWDSVRNEGGIPLNRLLLEMLDAS